MAISVVMPALEMAQETGKLISWLKKEGDTVAKGEPLLEVETDKAVMEVESPGDGVLAGVKVQAGAEVPVGCTIAWIVKPGETAPTEEAHVESGRKSASAIATSSSAVSRSSAPEASTSRQIKTSPKARRLASEKGVDLASVHGSGAGGEILASDILAAAEAKPVAPPTSSPTEGGSPIARLMAERTTQSWTTVPHFFLIRELDATAFNLARQQFAAEVEKLHGVKLTHTDLVVALVARVLVKHPKLNASWVTDSVRANADVNISLAMAVNEGVVAPVIPHADNAKLGEIAIRRRDLADRARANKLRPADLAGGTFTISNLGMYEIDAFTPVVNLPECAILGVGRVVARPVVTDETSERIEVRRMLALSLTFDHRLVDGAPAARFLQRVKHLVERPTLWLFR
jgi:pyruvate dehydrogenase E2 component (dihydrolipoamide acetyltransferase)